MSGFRAPESFGNLFDHQNLLFSNYEVNLWFLGVLIYYLCTFELPFGENLIEVEERVF